MKLYTITREKEGKTKDSRLRAIKTLGLIKKSDKKKMTFVDMKIVGTLMSTPFVTSATYLFTYKEAANKIRLKKEKRSS